MNEGRIPAPDLSTAYASDRRFLLGLCYRMTGSAADAEDIVQETFARALDRPPERRDVPWRPWLVRVASNLARDELRRRKRRGYKGPWLPEPIEDDALIDPAGESGGIAARYERMESVSFAFLLALEALSPMQRAVLLLRDVFEYTGAETGEALERSEENVRVLLHRARKAMGAYDASRPASGVDRRRATIEALTRFMLALQARDLPAMEALLADEVVTLNDAGGRYPAAGLPVIGRNKVARFHLGVADLRKALPRIEVRKLNGAPALIARFEPAPDDRYAPAFVTLVELDAAGRLRRIYTQLAPEKLRRLLAAEGDAAAPPSSES